MLPSIESWHRLPNGYWEGRIYFRTLGVEHSCGLFHDEQEVRGWLTEQRHTYETFAQQTQPSQARSA